MSIPGSDSGREIHAADIMMQACSSVLTLTSLLLTALLAFTGSIIGQEGVYKGQIWLAWVSGGFLLAAVGLSVNVLYKSVGLAVGGNLRPDNSLLASRFRMITTAFVGGVVFGLLYLFTVRVPVG